MFKNIYLLALILALSSCSLLTTREQMKEEKKSERPQEEVVETDEDSEWLLTIQPQVITIRPGEVSLLNIPGDFFKEAKVKCADKEIPFFLRDHRLVAFVSETYFSTLKPYSCTYLYKNHKIKIAEVEVLEKTFPSERIRVDKKRVFLSKKNQARADREREIKYAAYANSSERPFFYDAFELPIRSKVTSIYGSRRVFNKKKKTQHLGTDYRAAVGVPIKSANRGKVALSRDFFYTGHTVIIDHGLGIFTTYGHLSERLVEEGEIVPTGAIIGKAGSTGRSTAPHLHWGVTVNGLAVEGDSLIRASKRMPK